MLVRSAVRNISTSSSEHNAYVASLLILDGGGSEAATRPEKPVGSGGAADLPALSPPPVGIDYVVPPPAKVASSRKKANLFAPPIPRQLDLESVQNLEAEISALMLQILVAEQGVEEVQEAIARGAEYRGRRGEALQAVDESLVRKEQLLREKEKQLRDEKMMLLRLHAAGNFEQQQPRMTSTATPSTNIREGARQCNFDIIADVRKTLEEGQRNIISKVRLHQYRGTLSRRA